MKAKELIKRYSMDRHAENGMFIERHFENNGAGRASSGSIYYYVAPAEHTEFHRIDCDEYWCFNAGSSLELWIIGIDGKLRICRCGISEGDEPSIRLAAGEIFASRLPADASDGCFITCITVPRFSYDGFELISKDYILEMTPEAAGFWL